MNPKTAHAWIQANQWLLKQSAVPPLIAKTVGKKNLEAMRKARPAKPAIKLPKGVKDKETPSQLKKELDKHFSIFIRMRDSDENGIGQCVTCGYTAEWKYMDCGHYVPRQDLATRWDERNCHLQCKPCNGFRGGEPEKMAEYINRKYLGLTANGWAFSEMIKQKSKEYFRPSRQYFENMISHYKEINKQNDEIATDKFLHKFGG